MGLIMELHVRTPCEKNSGYATSSMSLRLYRAMHISAKRGIAIARRLSVRPSVCL